MNYITTFKYIIYSEDIEFDRITIFGGINSDFKANDKVEILLKINYPAGSHLLDFRLLSKEFKYMS